MRNSLKILAILYLSLSSTLANEYSCPQARQLTVLGSSGDFTPPTGRSVTLGTHYTITYDIYGNQIFLYIKFDIPGTAFNIGWGSSMTNADIWSFEISGNEVIVTDRWSTGQTSPSSDLELGGSSSLTRVGYEITDTYTQVTVSRSLNTGDSYDTPIVVGSNNVIWSYKSGSASTVQHDSNTRGTGTLTFGKVYGDISLPSSSLTLGSAITMYYEVVGTNFIAAFKCTVPGVAFHVGWSTSGMTNADIWIMEIAGNGINLSDRWSTGQSSPDYDTSQSGTSDLTYVGSEITSSYTIVKVKRAMNTGDTKDKVIAYGSNGMIWSYKAGSASLAQHDSSTRGTATLTLAKASGDYTLPSSSFSLGSAITVYYEITSSLFTAAIKCTVPNVAFNIGWGSSMTNADIWSFEISNNAVTATDRWSTGQSSPAADTAQSGTSDLTLLGYEITDTYTIAKVSRARSTGDTKDTDIVFGSNSLIWSYKAGSASMVQHDTSTRGTATAFFVTSNGDYTLPSMSLSLGSAITMYYQATSTTFTAAIKCTQPGIAFSVGFGSSMTNADIWTFEIVNGAVQATDRWSTGQSTPGLDTSQSGTSDLTLSGYEITSTYTIAKVSRAMNTADSKDKVITFGSNPMIWSYKSGSASLTQHDTSTRGTATLDLSKSSGDFTLPTKSFTLGSAITVYYDITSTTFTAAIKCTVPNVAFNIGWGSSMTNADIWSFQIVSDTVQASDRWSTGQTLPGLDTAQSGTSDLTLLGYEITDTYTIAKVSRSLTTSDTKDTAIVAGNNNLIWSYKAGSATIDQHSSTTRGTATADLGTSFGFNLKTCAALMVALIGLVMI